MPPEVNNLMAECTEEMSYGAIGAVETQSKSNSPWSIPIFICSLLDTHKKALSIAPANIHLDQIDDLHIRVLLQSKLSGMRPSQVGVY